jgi:hypothetical protein
LPSSAAGERFRFIACLIDCDACMQAVRNEDTRGDAAQLRLEIRRLKQQLQAWRDAALAAGVAPDGQGGGGPDSGGNGDPRGGAASSRSSSRRSSQRKVAVNNPAPWGDTVCVCSVYLRRNAVQYLPHAPQRIVRFRGSSAEHVLCWFRCTTIPMDPETASSALKLLPQRAQRRTATAQVPAQGQAAGHAAMAAALRREAAALADGRRLTRELEAAQALAAEREADNQRLKLIVKLRDGQVARLEVCAPLIRQLCLVFAEFGGCEVYSLRRVQGYKRVWDENALGTV